MESEKFISEMAVLGKNMEQDVVEQILSILPPKPLMRFKRVSKQWYALINNPRFVARHLSNSNSNSNSMHNTTLVLLKRLKLNDANTDQTEEVFTLLKFCNDSDNNDEHGFLASSEDVNIPVPMSLKTRGESLCVIGHCNGIICLAMANSCEVLLWNLATEEFKLLPTLPYLPDSRPREDWPPWSPQEAWWRYKDALGFGYCPKSNDYKVVNVHIGFSDYEEFNSIYIYFPPTAAVYTLGTDSWREAKSYYLETETTLLWPERFQMCFKGVCYWLGQEQHKELHVYDWMVERFIRDMIIVFDLGDEVFHAMLLPDSLYDSMVYCYNMRLLLWNESIALLGVHDIGSGHSTGSHFCLSFGIWAMDEVGWTKHVTFEFSDEKPLTFLKSDEILMADANGCLFTYNVGTKNLNYLPIQRVSNDSATVVYVDSIVSLLGGNKLETGDNSTNADFSLYKCSSFSYSIADKHCHSYSVWAIPSEDASLRIKKVMEGLRTEFAGPEIDPHIPVVGSIRMTHDEVLNNFRSLRSLVIYSYKAKVNEVVTRNFYYQCVSLLIDYSCSTVSRKLREATGQCRAHFSSDIAHRPHLSLLFGNLTIEERKLAQEKVSSMDESITSLSFPITRLALYKINYKDTTLKSWEKIAEYPLLFN